jgi:K+-transporting ATPase ATPase C chain
MWGEIRRQARPALTLLASLSLLLGLLYPAVITIVAHVAFPRQAHGSLILKAGRPMGSALIGQPFSDPGYFWARPSATGSFPYNAAASSGSNLGPTNPALTDAIRDRMRTLREADPDNAAPVPVDLVTASGSGLDPHISPAAAQFQVHRVARARHIDEAALRELIARFTEDRQLGILGEPRVNVLQLNLSLDAQAGRSN